MAAPVDILALTHLTVSSMVQEIVSLKHRMHSYLEIRMLLVESEGKTRRIGSSISSLSILSSVPQLDSAFFVRRLSDVQAIQHELVTIQSELINSSTPSTYLTASALNKRIVEINEKEAELPGQIT